MNYKNFSPTIMVFASAATGGDVRVPCRSVSVRSVQMF